MAEDKKMGPDDEKRLFAASAVSLFLVIFLCIVSLCAAKSHAGLPEYDDAGLEDLMMLLDGGQWAVDAEAKTQLEKHLGIRNVQKISTIRSGHGLDIILHTERSPYVLGAKKGKGRFEGVFADLSYYIFLLYEEKDPVFCIFLQNVDVLIEFSAL